MDWKSGVAIFLSLALAASPTHTAIAATPGTAASLGKECRAFTEIMSGNPRRMPPEDEWAYVGSAGRCVGFIDGFRNGHMLMVASFEHAAFCLPDGVTNDQIARVLVKQIEANPEEEHLLAGPYLVAILSATWPCAGS